MIVRKQNEVEFRSRFLYLVGSLIEYIVMFIMQCRQITSFKDINSICGMFVTDLNSSRIKKNNAILLQKFKSLLLYTMKMI